MWVVSELWTLDVITDAGTIEVSGFSRKPRANSIASERAYFESQGFKVLKIWVRRIV